MPIYTYPLIYLTVIIVGVFNYKKYSQNEYLKYFLFFLIYSFLTEVLGKYVSVFLRVRAYSVYNTWIILSSVFYFLFFLSRIKSSRKRNYIKILMAIHFSFIVISVLFLKDFFSEWLVSVNILGKILITITIFIYYAELLNSDALIYIYKSLFFWISIGVLLYAIGFIPVYVIGKFIDYQGIFRHITLGLNIVMNGCFIIGFINSKKEFNN